MSWSLIQIRLFYGALSSVVGSTMEEQPCFLLWSFISQPTSWVWRTAQPNQSLPITIEHNTSRFILARNGARASWSHLCWETQWSSLMLPQLGVPLRRNNGRGDVSCTWPSWFPALFGLKHDMCMLEELWKQSGSVGMPVCILIHPKCHYFSSFHSCVMTVLELNSNNQPKGLFACICAPGFCK